MEEFLNTLLQLVHDWGYLGILLLMAMESSVVPLSSKLIMIPAGYLAQKGELDIYIVVLVGTIGAMVGASINYFLARYVGKPLLHQWFEKKSKHSKFWTKNEKRLEEAEKIFKEYAVSSLILGNLVSGLRQFMPIPAGFVKMPFLKFLIFSFVGISVWMLILSLIGFLIGTSEELWGQYYLFSATILLLIVLIFVLSYFLHKKLSKKNESN